MHKILSLLFFAASTLNVWAADQSWVKVSEPGDLAYWVTVGKHLPSKNPDEVIYQTRRDFPDFFKVEKARLNCITGQKQVLSSDQYATDKGNLIDHVDFTKHERPLVYMLTPSQKEFKVACRS